MSLSSGAGDGRALSSICSILRLSIETLLCGTVTVAHGGAADDGERVGFGEDFAEDAVAVLEDGLDDSGAALRAGDAQHAETGVAHIKHIGGFGHDVAHDPVAVDEDDLDETLGDLGAGDGEDAEGAVLDVDGLGSFGEDGAGHALAVGEMEFALFPARREQRPAPREAAGRVARAGALRDRFWEEAGRVAPVCGPRDRLWLPRWAEARTAFPPRWGREQARGKFQRGRADFSISGAAAGISAGGVTSVLRGGVTISGASGAGRGQGWFGRKRWRVRGGRRQDLSSVRRLLFGNGFFGSDDFRWEGRHALGRRWSFGRRLVRARGHGGDRERRGDDGGGRFRWWRQRPGFFALGRQDDPREFGHFRAAGAGSSHKASAGGGGGAT